MLNQQTIAAIGFPVIIMLLVPVRYFIVPYLGISPEELDVLDGAVASPFVSVKMFRWYSVLTLRPWSLWVVLRKWNGIDWTVSIAALGVI